MADKEVEKQLTKGSPDAVPPELVRNKAIFRATWMVVIATIIIVVGLLDQLHAKVFCVGNTGITILRMVVYLTAITLVLTSPWTLIQNRRVRIYYGILAFFFGLWVVLQPMYYTAMRTDVSKYSCIWSADSNKRTLKGSL